MHNTAQSTPRRDAGNPAQAPHFLVQGWVLSPLRLFGHKPAHLYVEWPLPSPALHDPAGAPADASVTQTTPLPLLHAQHWGAGFLPIHLQRAWCVGAWQFLFFTSPWRPRGLEVFVCTHAHPMLRMFLACLQREAKQSLSWGGAHVF